MKPKIKSIKEIEIQMALGTIQLGSNIPKNITFNTKTYKLPVRGRIHLLLEGASHFVIVPRTELSKASSTQYSSQHISRAEVLGFLKRMCPYEKRNGKQLSFKLTEIGKQALKILDNNINAPRKFIKVPIKVDPDAYFYYATKSS